MPRRVIFAAAALVAAVVVFALVLQPPRAARVSLTLANDPRVVSGALHVHTTRSDGSGTVDEVASAAHAAGLQFVVFADHGDGRRFDPPAYRSGVLCIDGVEISTDNGHLVAAGMRPAPYRLAGEGRDVIDDVHRLGGIAYVAHPTSPRPALAWHGPDSSFDGFEWLNADTEWRSQPAAALGRVLAGYFMRPAAALARSFRRPVRALEEYDTLARRRPLLAIAGHDAHARIGPDVEEGSAGRRFRLPLPSYRVSFLSFATRLSLDAPLMGDAARDAAAVLHALRHGHAFTAIDGLAAPVRFSFAATSGRATAAAGDRLIPVGPVSFLAQADAPANSTILLLRDGREVARSGTPRLETVTAAVPGEYRVEVHLSAAAPAAMPWIVSNPIYVGVGDSRNGESAVAQQEEPASLVPAAWRVEHEPSSSGAVVAGEGGEVELSYSLGSDRARSPYVAAVYDLRIPAGTVGMAFDARAQQSMRFSFQLRAPETDPHAAGIRWRRAIFSDPEFRQVAVLWDDMRPVGREVSSHPDLRATTSLLVVVDLVNSDPGASGRLSLGGWRWVYPRILVH